MMMAPEYFTFTGRVDERIPWHITHVLIDKALKFVPSRAFSSHSNIEEVICHDGVLKIEQEAFNYCPQLRRVVMPGVKEVETSAFNGCFVLNYVECGKLERIGAFAFRECQSLNSIDLPSIRIVERFGFCHCRNLFSVNLGKDLESILEKAFLNCPSLERIALPLKDGVFADDSIFHACERLNHVNLVEGAVLNETAAALLLEEWKNDMNEEIEVINRILPTAPAGDFRFVANADVGEKAREVREWMQSVRRKIIHYKAEHQRTLSVAAATLQTALPNDIVFKNVLPFLELPSHTFEGEN